MCALALMTGKMPRNVVVEKMVGIVHLIIAFALWAHLCGCIYCFIGRIQEPAEEGAVVPWLHQLRRDEPGLFEEDDLVATYVIALYW